MIWLVWCGLISALAVISLNAAGAGYSALNAPTPPHRLGAAIALAWLGIQVWAIWSVLP